MTADHLFKPEYKTASIIRKVEPNMARKNNRPKPMDPAEIARRAYDERQRQKSPGNWGPNMSAMGLDQNREIAVTEATREKVARLQRFDCFATLGVTVDQHQAVRRYEELMAARFETTGASAHMERVDEDAGGRALSTRRLKAAETMEALAKLVERSWSIPLIERLTMPMIVEGRRVNWKAVVRDFLGLIDRDAQARHVKLAAQDLFNAWTAHDNASQKKSAA